MKKLNLVGGLADILAKANLNLKVNAPKILVASGIVGVVASGVMACRATLKVEKVVEKAKANINTIYDEAEPENVKKELVGAYAKAGADVALLYLPAVGLGALSITAILSAHNILSKRNAALGAAYSTLSKVFKGYRDRVVDRYGEEAERRIRYDIKEEVIEETEVDENGKEVKVKKKVEVSGLGNTSGYSRFFMKLNQNDLTQGSANWQDDDIYCETFITHGMRHLGDLLRANKYLFLNDVYDYLGFARSIAGQSVGWIYDRDKPVGDNYIDFKVVKVWRKDADGNMQRAWLIDFNVDGDILQLAKDRNLITQ